jgi:hypothetical protein
MNSSQQPRSFWQTMGDWLLSLSSSISYGLVVLVRDRPGYRTLSLPRLLVLLLFLLAIPAMLNDAASFQSKMPGLPLPSIESPFSDRDIMMFYAFATLVGIVGWVKHVSRWGSLEAGESWHTRSIGLTYLYKIPILRKWAPLVAENRLQRFIDPLLWLVLSSSVVMQFSRLLGIWLMLSSVMLGITEEILYQKDLGRTLDAYDNLIESEVLSRNLQAFSRAGERGEGDTGTSHAPPPLDVDDSAGIPTGVGWDIKVEVERRRKQREKNQKSDDEHDSSAEHDEHDHFANAKSEGRQVLSVRPPSRAKASSGLHLLKSPVTVPILLLVGGLGLFVAYHHSAKPIDSATHRATVRQGEQHDAALVQRYQCEAYRGLSQTVTNPNSDISQPPIKTPRPIGGLWSRPVGAPGGWQIFALDPNAKGHLVRVSQKDQDGIENSVLIFQKAPFKDVSESSIGAICDTPGDVVVVADPMKFNRDVLDGLRALPNVQGVVPTMRAALDLIRQKTGVAVARLSPVEHRFSASAEKVIPR